MPTVPPRPKTLISAVMITAVALLLSGCAAGTDDSKPTSTAATCTNAPADPLADLVAAKNPRALVGPATACLSGDAIPVPAVSPTPQLPVTVTDNQGTAVTVTDASRILALDLSGTLAATVFALGLGDNVVGRDTSTGFAQAKKLPEVTRGGHQLSAEAILELHPTVVLTDTSIGPWDVLLQLRQAGIPVVVLTPDRSLANVTTIVKQVAAALGVPDSGATLDASLAARIAATKAKIASIAPVKDRLRVLFLYVRGNANVYYVFGKESGADDLITSLGATDVAAEVGITGMRPVTAESLVQAAPDVILVMTKGLESTGGVDGLLKAVPAVAATPAGENRRIVDMSDYEILSFGPRTPEVLAALARALYAS